MKHDPRRDAMEMAQQLVKAAVIIAETAITTDRLQMESWEDFRRYCQLAVRTSQDYINARNKMKEEK